MKPKYSRKALKDAKAKLIKEYKIEPSRIKVLYGGFFFVRENIALGMIECWVVPEGSSFGLPQSRKSVKKR